MTMQLADPLAQPLQFDTHRLLEQKTYSDTDLESQRMIVGSGEIFIGAVHRGEEPGVIFDLTTNIDQIITQKGWCEMMLKIGLEACPKFRPTDRGASAS